MTLAAAMPVAADIASKVRHGHACPVRKARGHDIDIIRAGENF
jgi:hypothetical protein